MSKKLGRNWYERVEKGFSNADVTFEDGKIAV